MTHVPDCLRAAAQLLNALAQSLDAGRPTDAAGDILRAVTNALEDVELALDDAKYDVTPDAFTAGVEDAAARYAASRAEDNAA